MGLDGIKGGPVTWSLLLTKLSYRGPPDQPPTPHRKPHDHKGTYFFKLEKWGLLNKRKDSHKQDSLLFRGFLHIFIRKVSIASLLPIKEELKLHSQALIIYHIESI